MDDIAGRASNSSPDVTPTDEGFAGVVDASGRDITTFSAYYGNWTDWTQVRFVANMVNLAKTDCRYVYISFMAPTRDGIVFPPRSTSVTSKWIAAAKQAIAALKLQMFFIVSVGGWSYSTTGKDKQNYFAPFHKYSVAAFRAWAELVWKTTEVWGFDGIDLDYEGPDNWREHGTLTTMITALASTKPSRVTQGIAVTVPGSWRTARPVCLAHALTPAVRIINVMLYDEGKSFDAIAEAQKFIDGGISRRKLGFGLELGQQASSTYTMTIAECRSRCLYAVKARLADIFIWKFPSTPPSIFGPFKDVILGAINTTLPLLASTPASPSASYFATDADATAGVYSGIGAGAGAGTSTSAHTDAVKQQVVVVGSMAASYGAAVDTSFAGSDPTPLEYVVNPTADPHGLSKILASSTFRPGDCITLQEGNYGDVHIANFFVSTQETPYTVRVAAGQCARFDSFRMSNCRHWLVQGITASSICIETSCAAINISATVSDT
jgi:hypothetical protein